MKKSRFAEDKIAALAKQERGMATAEVCRKHGTSSATFYKWKAKFGGMDLSETRKLKMLETENAQLKKLLADAMLHAAHLDQLLPIAAVARESGDFAGRYRADFPEADLGHHPFKPDAHHATRGRSPEIVVHCVDLGPAERHEPIAHGIL